MYLIVNNFSSLKLIRILVQLSIDTNEFQIKREALTTLSVAASMSTHEQIIEMVNQGFFEAYALAFQIHPNDIELLILMARTLEIIFATNDSLSRNVFAESFECLNGVKWLSEMQVLPNNEINSIATNLLEDYYNEIEITIQPHKTTRGNES